MNPLRHTSCFIILFFSSGLAAQVATQDTVINRKVFGLSLHKGTVFIHKPSVESAKGAYPLTVGIEISKQRLDYSAYSICRSYIRTGPALYFTDFDNKGLGYGFIGAYFIEPVYRVGKRFQFQFRGDIGLGYFTNPYHAEKNPSNKAYSTRVASYLHAGAGFGARLSKKLTVQVNGNFNHISNGHFKQPNAGLNWIMLSGSLLYYPEENELPKHRFVRTRRTNRQLALDLGCMFVPGQGYHEQWYTKRNYMAGIFGQSSLPISRINALSLGAELTYNKFEDDPAAPKDNSKPALTSGVHIGHEFLIGKVIFSQQIGKYITRYPWFVYSTYHRWGLRFQVNRHWFAGFNMKAHKEFADLIDFRLQYRF